MGSNFQTRQPIKPDKPVYFMVILMLLCVNCCLLCWGGDGHNTYYRPARGRSRSWIRWATRTLSASVAGTSLVCALALRSPKAQNLRAKRVNSFMMSTADEGGMPMKNEKSHTYTGTTCGTGPGMPRCAGATFPVLSRRNTSTRRMAAACMPPAGLIVHACANTMFSYHLGPELSKRQVHLL